MKNNKKGQVKINESNLTSHEKEEFEKLCRILSDPNYSSGSWALPENPTLLEKGKHDICKKILVYKQKRNLSTEKLAKKIKLSVPETEDILYCHIDYFTFDRLLDYAGKLFSPSEISVVVEKKNKLRA